jgi:cyclin D1/2/4, plant
MDPITCLHIHCVVLNLFSSKVIFDFVWQVAEAKFVFEGRTIKRMELLVLRTLKWRMHAVTACSFVEYFLHKLSDHGAPSLLARSRSSDLVLSTAKGTI